MDPNAVPTGGVAEPRSSRSARARGVAGLVLERLAAVPPPRWRWLAALAIAGFTVASIAVNSLVVDGTRYFWLDDDQMISMRYARNFADGLGPVWNAGERVEGYTNFLWMSVMAVVHLLPIPDAYTSLVVKVIAGLLALSTLLSAERILRFYVRAPGLALPVLLVALALCRDVIYWAVHGFETALVTALFAFVVARLLWESESGGPRVLTYAALGAIPLARSDAHLLWATAALLALAVSDDRRRTSLWLVAAGMPVVAHLGFRLAYYGDWFPNTYYLKVVGNDLGERLAAGRRYVATFLLDYWYVLLLAVVGAVRAGGRSRAPVLAGTCVVLVYCLWTGGDLWYGARFLAPLVPVLVVLAIVAASELGRAEAAAGLVLMACVPIVVGALPLAKAARSPELALIESVNGGPRQSVLTAIAIRENTRPDAKVAVHAAGIVPYFSRRHSIDWLGKSDRAIARGPVHGDRVGHNKYDAEHSLGRLGADLAVMLWLPENLGSCSPRARMLAERVAPAWVSAIYLSDVFQREFCGGVIEYHGATPIYVRRTSPEFARIDRWREPLVTLD